MLGQPHLSIVAYGSHDSTFPSAELMAAQGWLPGLVQKPKGIHRMMSMIHEPSLDEYLDTVRKAVSTVRGERTKAATALRPLIDER